jgi:class 3 adenylate cyclase
LPEPEPDEPVCGQEDVDVFRIFLAAEEFLGEAVAMQMARVVGAAMARVADSAVSAEELGAVLTEFDACATDTVVAGGGRLVKLIGDEAMFTAPDAGIACAIALDLVRSLAEHPVLPTARGGLAAGEVLSREGDYFGPVVNLAARAVKLADPGAVLASPEVARQSADGYRFTSAGRRGLKGFDEPVELFRVERAS